MTNREWYEKHKGLILEKRREYRQLNKEKIAIQKRKRRIETKDAINAYHRKWKKTEAGKASVARAGATRRGKNRKVLNDLTSSQWEEIKRKQNYKCAWCGEVKPLHRDHIVPLTLGGRLTLKNVQGLCISCNGKKSIKIDSSSFQLILSNNL